MADNFVKNLAAATIAGTLLSFIIASTAVGIAVVVNLTTGPSLTPTGVSSFHR
ncbi:MAG TPA: hypothetical protein V6C91_19065 [Coleofasciculaceae cyanobacterium]